MVFDIAEWAVRVIGFVKEDLEAATQQYLEVEREIANGASKQAVLVGSDSMSALKKAYPSYYGDTAAFLVALERATT